MSNERGNRNLHDSIKNKQDKFYTQLPMIEDELRHYKNFFNGKVVFCNCDDPYESNFFKYFALNFNTLGLKKLITTSFKDSPITGTQLSFIGNNFNSLQKPYKIEITQIKDLNNDGRIDLEDIKLLLKEDGVKKDIESGDFRSPECINLLQEADVVVTNPPFSLFREYVDILIKNKKKFLIIGNINAVSYKNILPLIMDNEIWLGYNHGHFWFQVPNYYEPKKTDYKEEDGKKFRRMGNIAWFTNIEIDKLYEDMTLYKEYSKDEYPYYDNFDAIEISKTAEIPRDFFGVMGVPITFINNYCPYQFKILNVVTPNLNGKAKFKRILIQRVDA